MGVQVVPALVVFQTFPEEAATYQVLRSVGSMAMSAMRPDATAGPMLRHLKDESRPELSSAGSSASDSWAWSAPGSRKRATSPARAGSPVKEPSAKEAGGPTVDASGSSAASAAKTGSARRQREKVRPAREHA